MYTAEQVLEGLLNYIRHEVIPILPTSAKLMAGAALLHNSGRVGEVLKNTDALKTIGLIDNGNVDVDIWTQDLKRSMDEFCGGKAEIQLPLLSPIILTSGDIDTLKRYIKGELR